MKGRYKNIIMQKNNLTKKIFIEKLAKNYGSTIKNTKLFLDNFFDLLTSSLIEYNKVTFTGFCNFNLKRREARKARNPKGIIITIAARNVITFKMGKNLKQKINK